MWWQLAKNPRAVLAYYDHPPPLLGIEVHSVRLFRDGPTLQLIAEMPSFPNRTSPRWPVGANTAHAGLRFFDLRAVELSGWGTTNVGDLLIENAGGMIRFRFESSTARLAGAACFFDLTDITGYIKGRAESATAVDLPGR